MTIDADEVARFAAQAEMWWDEAGPFAALHRLNPLRIAFIRDALAAAHGRDPLQPRPLAGLRILDVGCGGGLLCEPLARLGADVTGLDPASESIAVARAHAREAGLEISYRTGEVAALAAEGRSFDGVLAMEVVEHVADRAAFVAACCTCVAPGGVLALATLNRTLKAFALAVVGAEYVLGWLPRGSHDWRKFTRPSELIGEVVGQGLEVETVTGVTYDVLARGWRTGRDLGVNYMLAARRATSSASV